MLVLSRVCGESIIINEHTKVTFLAGKVKDNGEIRIRLGIEAPHNVSVHREEVFLKIQKGALPKKKKRGKHIRIVK